MKKIKIIIITTIILIISSTCFSKETIVAKVNNEIILKSDVKKYKYIYKLLSNNKTQKQSNIFKKNLLTDIITIKIQLNLAKKYNIKIEEKTIDLMFKKIVKEKKKSIKQYYQTMKENNVTPKSLYSFIKNSLIIEKLEKQLLLEEKPKQKINLNSKKEHIPNKYLHIKINNNENINDKFKWILNILNKKRTTQTSLKTINNKNTNFKTKIIKKIPTRFLNKYNKNHKSYIMYKNKTFHIIKAIKHQNNKIEFKIKPILIKNKSKTKINKEIKQKLIDIKNKLTHNKNTINTKNKKNIKQISVNKKNIQKKLYNTIKELNTGETSNPIKTKIGWFIIKIIEKEKKEKNKNHYQNNLTFKNNKKNWINSIISESTIEIVNNNNEKI